MHKSTAFSPTRALQSSWDILTKAPLAMWVGGLILVTVESLGGMGGGGGDLHIHGAESVDRFIWMVIPLMMAGFLLTILLLAVTAWLKVGYFLGVEKVMRDGEVEFEDLYKARGRWKRVFLTTLLQAFLSFLLVIPAVLCALVAVAVGEAFDADDGVVAGLAILSVLAYIPVMIYFFMGMVLMPYPAALDGRGPIESLSDSWQLASGIRGQIFLMLLLSVALTLLGLCACFVGIIPAGVISQVMFCEAYIQATRTSTDNWWIRTRAVETGPRDGETQVAMIDAEPLVDEARMEPETEPETEGPDESADSNAEADLPVDQPQEEGPFDPSAWRKDEGIPPIEED